MFQMWANDVEKTSKTIKNRFFEDKRINTRKFS